MPFGENADIAIYGATSAEVMAAVQARRMGKTVVLLEPGQHIGGMATSGLQTTDIGRREVIGGLAREYYQRAYAWYLSPRAWLSETRADYIPKHRDTFYEAQKMQFFIEPHVAENLFNEFLREHGVDVIFGERLDRTPPSGGTTATAPAAVRKEGPRITTIRMESGRTLSARMFIDATYEGDLMAAAGVRHMLGREPNSRFDETLNGIRCQAPTRVDPYVRRGEPASGLLPGIEPAQPGADGTGDRRIQAYNFRVCLTDVSGNRLPIPWPDNYDAAHYELLARELEEKADHFPGRSLFKLSPLPNRKTDSNNHGFFSTDFIGHSHDWPEAGYARRAEIWRAHHDYTLGFFRFPGNDARVPQAVRKEVRRWGLPADEFPDSGHWPRLLYVREARRLHGPYVITEHDCAGRTSAPDPVGMGSYHMDSHPVSRYAGPDGRLCMDGNFFERLDPYGISYRALTPREEECVNLLVPVCVSATHVAYGSVRMEPVFMILGQSAATAAAQAIDAAQAIQQVDYEKLRTQLLQDGQILEFPAGGGKSK
ncbi:MAG: FAD-dependent oxidoreductase [Opitutaceae bacterium]|jgi:hypothetical protein|nr:FAD-dependent oxidoreductase [Opitutaceae bacterium]